MFTKTVPYSQFSDAVYNVVEQPQRVFLSIFDVVETIQDETGDEYSVISCPDVESDDIILNGECKFSINNSIFSSEHLISDIVSNPTWRTILNICNDMLGKCDLHNTGFLCDIIPSGEGMYEFVLVE